ncbi:MAG: polysaccharide deacetylase family protein [Pseudomonadota bacterium]
MTCGGSVRRSRRPALGIGRAAASIIGRVVIATALTTASTVALACTPGPTDLGVSRIVQIDARHGPVFGRATKFAPQPSFLKPGEVVLTFDDGPTPKVTARILEALRDHCTRATFFPVGKRAVSFPDLIRRTERDGHTIGGHTWSHPNNLTRIKPGRARDEIERGFAAVSLAAQRPLAPFFRFPGLNDNRDLLAYTQSRKLAVFSVDVISNDSYARSVNALVNLTRKRTRAQRGGILLFHDLRMRTAAAIPRILRNLKRDGFKVVHVVPSDPFVRDRGYDSVLEPRVKKAVARRDSQPLAARPEPPLGLTIPVTSLAPMQARFDLKNSRPATASTAAQPVLLTPPMPKPAARGDAAEPAARPASGGENANSTEAPTGEALPQWRTTIGPGFR